MNAGQPVHAPIRQFDVQDNCLVVGGMSLTELARKVGQTPFYAYDRALMSQRVAALRAALPPSLRLHYAMKANPMTDVVAHMAALTDGLDVASWGELQIALDAGMQADRISFAGPGKSDHDLAAAVRAGVTLNIESEGELERVVATGEALGLRPRVAIRINPAFEVKLSGMKMSGGAKPFGIDEERVPAVLKQLTSMDLEFRGFHIFAGSQSLDTEVITTTHRLIFELAARLAGCAPQPLPWLNFGGALGVPYFPGEQPLALEPIANNLHQLIERARKSDVGNADIVMELGRYLVAEAGIYVCEVVDRKVSRGQTFLVTNGGLHHHLAASGNFGQVIRKNYPVCIGNRMQEAAIETVNVVGPLCTPLDILADRMELPRARPGDLVVVFQSGAYGFSASPRSFLSHPEPAQIVV